MPAQHVQESLQAAPSQPPRPIRDSINSISSDLTLALGSVMTTRRLELGSFMSRAFSRRMRVLSRRKAPGVLSRRRAAFHLFSIFRGTLGRASGLSDRPKCRSGASQVSARRREARSTHPASSCAPVVPQRSSPLTPHLVRARAGSADYVPRFSLVFSLLHQGQLEVPQAVHRGRCELLLHALLR